MDAQEQPAPALDQNSPLPAPLFDAHASSSRQSVSARRSSVSTTRSKLSAADSQTSHTSGRGSHDSKPRLSKEQHETLERHYQCEPKPSTQTKREFSTRLGVSVEKVNNWFQNRRAKTKHELKKQQESQFLNGAEQLHGSEQYGHPLAENHLIDDAFFQTIGGAPDPQMHHFRRPEHSIHDAPSFSTIPTIPEEPAVIGEDPGFYNFFGLSDGDEQKVDLNTVAAISKQFNPPSLDFDPAAALRRLEEMYRNNSSAALSSMTEGSSSHPSQDFSAAGSVPGVYDSRRPSSSVVSMHTAPSASRTSSTSWAPQQHEQYFSGLSGPAFQAFGPGTPFADGMNFQMTAPAHSRQDSIVYSPMEQPDMGDAFANIAMPQPVLPSQMIAAQHPQQLYEPVHPLTQTESAPPLGLGSHVPSRCESGTSMLADSMDQIELQAANNGTAGLKHSVSSSTLAARRQRRPAQLGQAAMRSVSYHNGTMTANEHNTVAGSVPDPSLRRIKSSSVLSGRVQKPGSASSQKSPFSVSFSDATQRSPVPFTPLDSSTLFNWGQIHPAQSQPMQSTQHLQATPVPMQMAQQLGGAPDMGLYMEEYQLEPYVFPPQMSGAGTGYLPTPLESQAGSTPPRPDTKAAPELQFQTYQPRDPVDPTALPPKSKNTSPRGGAYQFQVMDQTSFTASPRTSSLKCSTTPG